MVVKKDIRSLSIDQLKEILEENSFQSFRAKQIYHWLWKKSSHDFSSMHNLPKKLLTFLENNFVIRNIEISKQQKSKDGTIKNDSLFKKRVLGLTSYLDDKEQLMPK